MQGVTFSVEQALALCGGQWPTRLDCLRHLRFRIAYFKIVGCALVPYSSEGEEIHLPLPLWFSVDDGVQTRAKDLDCHLKFHYGATIEEMARRTGVTPRTIRRWSRGVSPRSFWEHWGELCRLNNALHMIQ